MTDESQGEGGSSGAAGCGGKRDDEKRVRAGRGRTGEPSLSIFTANMQLVATIDGPPIHGNSGLNKHTYQ